MKKLFFGLLVAGVAFAGSAFTNVDSKVINAGTRTIPAGFLVQTAEGVYEYRSSLDGTCTPPSSNICAYEVASENNIPSQETYSPTEIATYSGVSIEDSETKLYVD